MKDDSPKYKLNKKDMLKIAKGAGLAAGGAVVVFLVEILPNVDFGELTYMIIPIVSIILNSALKFVKNK